jgi:integrase
VRGLALTSRTESLRYTRRFLIWLRNRHGDKFLDRLNGVDVLEFITEFAGRHPSGSWRNSLCSYTCVFLRYLRWRGIIHVDLDRVVPKLPKWRLSNVPRHLPWEEVRQLIESVDTSRPTGLRISEIVRLDREDVDLKTGVLNVRCSKFNKRRLVPLHRTTLQVVCNCAAARDAAFPNCKAVAFFINSRQKRFARNTLQQLFAGVACCAGLRGPKGRGPSFHNLRHHFATERLVRWYKAGIDVQAMLPALATYMGHAHYTDTAYYLTATAELLALAGERYQRWLARKEAE